MRILCAYSSIEFRVEHISFGLQSRESYHPIFDAKSSKLIEYITTHWPEKTPPIESYLCYIALLRSTDRLAFHVPAIRTNKTDAVIAQNMESLLRTVQNINKIQVPGLQLPSFVISPETRSLENSHFWIEAWNSALSDFYDGHKRSNLHEMIVTKEQVMERFIKDPSKSPSNYANTLADWAALAGSFPVTETVPYNGEQVTLSEYWKTLIRKCARAEALFSIDDVDLQDLIDHCEDKIDQGSIHTYTLMKVLRDARDRKKTYLGLGDLDISTSTYRILSDSDSAERANILAMIDSAPSDKPIASNYPSKIAFLRAQFKWQASQDYKAQGGN